MAEPEKKEPVIKKNYGKINLTLENCLLPPEKLDVTPSELDGLDRETETDLRILGCELIQTAGILLKLPQVSATRENCAPYWKFLSTNIQDLWLKFFFVSGGHGCWASAFSAFFLLQVLRKTQYGGHSDELHLSGLKDWRGAKKDPWRHKCV